MRLRDAVPLLHAASVLLNMRWRADPRVLLLAAACLLPAVLVWGAALAGSLGLGHPLGALPSLAARSSHVERTLLLVTFWAVTLACPLAASVLALLAVVNAELRVENWEITGRLRLPVSPWQPAQLAALLLLALGVVLFVAMAGHLAADCLLAGDC